MPPDSPSTFLIVLALLGVAAVCFGALWLVRRLRMKARVRELGWTFVTSPGLEVIWGLNCPPFGLGGDRVPDDLIAGTTTGGVPFSAFRYDHAGGRRHHVGCLRLERALPEAHLSRPGRERAGLVGVLVEADGWSVVAQDAAWASEVAGRLAGPLASVQRLIPDVTASLDGDALVLSPFPRDPDGIVAALAASDELVRAADALAAEPPPVPPEVSVYRHPDWVYRPVDDGALDRVTSTGGGFNHEARDVVYAGTPALALVALNHHWDTTEVRMAGKTPQTYTKHHSEPLAEIVLGFPFGDLSLNQGLGGRVHFESEDFNRAYAVRCADDRFAYDVIHPQLMEWLLAHPAPRLAIQGRHLRFEVPDIDVATLEGCLGFAFGFFGRVRRYTWENLGLSAPPVAPVGELTTE